MTVHILMLENKYGADIRAFTELESAREALRAHMAENWVGVVGDEEMPGDLGDALVAYFEDNDRESYELDSVELEEDVRVLDDRQGELF